MNLKECACGNDVEMGHTQGRHDGEDFGIVHACCGECGRLFDDIQGEWILPLQRKPHGKGGTMPGQNECFGCGAKAGELHGAGCDWEQCPVCGEQLIGCEHRWELLEGDR